MATRPQTGAWVMTAFAICPGTARAEVTVREAPTAVTPENMSVRVALRAEATWVPAELACKLGNRRNLTQDGFTLYYQYVLEDGTLGSAYEDSPTGRLTNTDQRIEQGAEGATLELAADTPHSHVTRRITVLLGTPTPGPPGMRVDEPLPLPPSWQISG